MFHVTIHNHRWLVCCLALCLGLSRFSFGRAEDPEANQLRQDLSAKLKSIRAANQPADYEALIVKMGEAIGQFPEEATLLALRGQAHFEHSGVYARQGDFAKSAEISRKAYGDFDAAVAKSPNDPKVRAARGSSYAYLPAMLGKSEMAMADLKMATEHKDFSTLFPQESQATIWLQLGTLYAAAGKPALATDAFRTAIQLSPQSKIGEKAKEELVKLGKPVSAVDPQGNRRPDRFPSLPIESGPLMVAATVTIPEVKDFSNAQLPGSMKSFLEAVTRQPGFQGMHRLESLDTTGMFVIFTWWKDKTALNNFFYSDAHQGIIRKYYQESQPSLQVDPTKPLGQVGIEVFSVLPAGRTVNGGLTPKLASHP
jgi:heme-degrading monooxygenase HmoA